jgi:FkbM family methyltransferase
VDQTKLSHYEDDRRMNSTSPVSVERLLICSLLRFQLAGTRRYARLLANRHISRALCLATRPFIEKNWHTHNLARILSGPARGRLIAFSAHERPSYILETYERHIFRSIRQHLRLGAVVYDVGAHVGYTSLVFSSIVGESGHVYAFEPDPRNYESLQTTVKINNVTNITPIRLAVSRSSANVRLATFSYTSITHIESTNTPDDAIIVPARSTTIDDFIFSCQNTPPSLIKVDIEGGEIDALQGSLRALREIAPIVVVEVRETTFSEVFSLMSSLGFTCRHLVGPRKARCRLVTDLLFLPPNK